MAAEGLAYGKRTHTYNSRLAQELGSWGDTLGHTLGKASKKSNPTEPSPGDRLHNALYRAYFVDGIDISDTGELIQIAQSVGLDGQRAQSVLESREYSAAVDADWAKAQDSGITGVPTFVAQGMGVPGAQPYEVLARLVEKATEVRNRRITMEAD